MRKGTLEGTLLLSNTGPLKAPLPLFFVDLEARNNNKGIYRLQFLQHCNIRAEPAGHRRVISQSTRCQSCGHTEGWLHRVHGAKAMATQKSDCTIYTVPKLWPYRKLIAQGIQVPKLWPYKRVIYNIHGTKAMVTQKNDCTTQTVPKLWPHKIYCSKPYICVKCVRPHNTQSCKLPRDTPPTHINFKCLSWNINPCKCWMQKNPRWE
jgi:hypothetical protein